MIACPHGCGAQCEEHGASGATWLDDHILKIHGGKYPNPVYAQVQGQSHAIHSTAVTPVPPWLFDPLTDPGTPGAAAEPEPFVPAPEPEEVVEAPLGPPLSSSEEEALQVPPGWVATLLVMNPENAAWDCLGGEAEFVREVLLNEMQPEQTESEGDMPQSLKNGLMIGMQILQRSLYQIGTDERLAANDIRSLAQAGMEQFRSHMAALTSEHSVNQGVVSE